MNDGHTTSVASLGINTQFSGSSVSSGSSPLNSPLVSPAANTSFAHENSSWDQLQNQFTQQMSLQPPSPAPPPVATKPGSGNTFVHKLYNMVVDKQYQHLIAWTYTGTSFIVCNITEFSRDVLPKHFKHNNFSSFVRQLNMYGFHKVNKSPRGHRTLAENQIWEFSHPKFLRNRPDLLDEIKRKALESESVRRDTNDISSHMAMMQMSQSDMLQQISHLQENLNQVMNELAETKKRQNVQQQMMKDMMDFMSKQYGTSFSSMDMFDIKADPDRPPPPIFITSADNSQQQQQPNFYLNINDQSPSTPNSPLSTASSPRLNHISSNNPNNNPQLSVQTQNLQQQQQQQQQQLAIHQFPPQHQQSPSLTPTYQQAANTPLPPSPCPSPGQFLDDDGSNQSMYHPRSPMLGPNAYMMDAQQQQRQQQQQQQQQQQHRQQQQQHYNNNSF